MLHNILVVFVSNVRINQYYGCFMYPTIAQAWCLIVHLDGGDGGSISILSLLLILLVSSLLLRSFLKYYHLEGGGGGRAGHLCGWNVSRRWWWWRWWRLWRWWGWWSMAMIILMIMMINMLMKFRTICVCFLLVDFQHQYIFYSFAVFAI